MPGSIDLKTFLEERFLIYDPDTDLTEGSPAQLTVIDPTVRRFQPDPFEMDLPTFIKARLRQAFPDLQTEDGDALADFLVKPMEALLDPFVREVQFLRNNQSLANPELLAPDEADSLMGNIFVRRSRGQKAVGTVRMYFNAATALTVSVGNNFYTADGLNFLPSTPQSISAEAMLFNQSGNLFYFDVSVEAETEGDEYNLDPEQIVGVANVSSAVRVTNLRKFSDGLPEESTIGYIERGENSLTERSMVVPRGVLARLFDVFGDLQHLQVVGFNDPEMLRDILTGGGLGPVVHHAVTGFSQDDGNGDGYSSIFEDASADFVSLVGPIGSVSNFTVTVGGDDYLVTAVISAQALQVTNADGTSSTMSDSLLGAEYYLRKNILTLSGIPGGIVHPLGPRGDVLIEGNEVHIGGCSDFYVRGLSAESAEQVIQALSDEQPLMEGKDLMVHQAAGTTISDAPTDVVSNTPTSPDFITMGVRVGYSLVIEGAGVSVAGSYQILKVAPRGNPQELQVYPAPGSPFTNLSYKIVNDLDVNLNEPKNVRDSGTDLKTVMGSKQVSTVSEVDFSGVGGQVDDTLRVSGGSLNEGDYTVQQITGTGNKLLVLASEMRRTSDTEPWMLFKKQEGIQLPLLRINSIDLLDSSLSPTGETIPYADPVDIQSSAFSNAGVGVKKEVSDARVGIVGTTDFNVTSPATLNGTQIYVVKNGGLYSVTFSGIVTLQDAIDLVNLAVPAIAAEFTVGNQSFFCLRSTTRWLQVMPYGSANAVLGLSTTEIEDSRQLVSPSVTDWELFGVKAESDSAYIMSGDAIGYWYVQSVSVNKILICNVNDEGAAVFPLPGINTTVRIGSRSFGKVRCYFLEPTSFEVRGRYRKAAGRGSVHLSNVIFGSILEDEEARTEFAYDVYGDGKSFQKFFPDPELSFQLLPVTSEDVPDNLVVTNGSDVVECIQDSGLLSPTDPGQFSRKAVIDFLLREIQPGDILEITYQPMQGTADIRDTTSGGDIDYAAGQMTGQTLTFSIESGPDKTVTFSNQVDGPEKLVAEINAQMGSTFAYIETTTTKKHLRFEADFAITLRTSASPYNANVTLGLTPGNNDAKAKGEYTVVEVGSISGTTANHSRITLDQTFSSGEAGGSQHYVIRRPGVQRISSTEMANNKDGALYYADIELVSEGSGDDFNIEPDLQLEASNYKSDGYHLYTEDENLSFTTSEILHMVVGRRMLSVGGTDSPQNMRQLSLSNIQLNYERTPIVEQIQNFAQGELDRVLNASILVRHLQPHFVQFQMNYAGGSQANVVIDDVTNLIDSLLPDEALEASAIGEIPRRRGATSVDMPITLIGIVHYEDRRVRAVRSQNAITAGRLATFIPDVLDVTRESGV